MAPFEKGHKHHPRKPGTQQLTYAGVPAAPITHGHNPPRNKRKTFQANFLEALAKDFEEHGEGVIRIVRIETPQVYLKIVASLMPRELIVDQSATADMRRDEIDMVLSAIRARLAENMRMIEHQPEQINGVQTADRLETH